MKNLHWAVIQFNYALVGIGSVGSIMIIDLIYQISRFGLNDPLNPISWPLSISRLGWMDVAAGALANVIGQNFMTVANQYSNPGVVAILNYIGIFYNFGLDRLFFDVDFTHR